MAIDSILFKKYLLILIFFLLISNFLKSSKIFLSTVTCCDAAMPLHALIAVALSNNFYTMVRPTNIWVGWITLPNRIQPTTLVTCML